MNGAIIDLMRYITRKGDMDYEAKLRNQQADAENQMQLDRIQATSTADLNKQKGLADYQQQSKDLEESKTRQQTLDNLLQIIRSQNPGIADQDAAVMASRQMAEIQVADPLSKASLALNTDIGNRAIRQDIPAQAIGKQEADMESNAASQAKNKRERLFSVGHQLNAPQAGAAQGVADLSTANRISSEADRVARIANATIDTAPVAAKTTDLMTTANNIGATSYLNARQPRMTDLGQASMQEDLSKHNLGTAQNVFGTGLAQGTSLSDAIEAHNTELQAATSANLLKAENPAFNPAVKTDVPTAMTAMPSGWPEKVATLMNTIRQNRPSGGTNGGTNGVFRLQGQLQPR